MIAKSEMQDSGHFSDLDGVRGLLAFTVMLFHYGLNTILARTIGIGPPVWDSCVDFFFVLSGFVICKSISGRAVSVRHFSAKRILRLFPLHIAVLILFSPVLFDGEEGAIDLILNISAIAPLVLQKMENFPAWSMGFEFYLPIIFVALFSRRGLSTPVVAGVTAILFVIATAASYEMLARNTLFFGPFLDFARAIAGLGLGFMAWKIYERGVFVGFPRWNGPIFILIILSFFGLVMGSVRFPLLGFFLPLLLLAAMFFGSRSHTFFSSWLFQWAGRLSFGVYMVHIPVLLVFTRVVGPVTLDGSIIFKGAMIVVSVVVALALHILIERPAMRIGRDGFLGIIAQRKYFQD
ncbi:acyltransferase [Loktanella salsilacus]|uniref:acyltransferase family protein n=1 Tax=Loktanella salsilacus TaxID=195913 RepID=UPI0020B789DB|nr:acyltransferase [Loktanella salsilacus]UTH48462.1 acyltransferase [Loktanella salsilacus]